MATPAILRRVRDDSRSRRIAYGVVLAILVVLCFVPRPYVARAKLLPQDSSSSGLGQLFNSVGGQASSLASVLTGSKPQSDLYQIIGRSSVVTGDVIKALHLVGPGRLYATDHAARVALGHKVDIHLLLGGVVEVETTSRDPDLALRLTSAYMDAISNRISGLGRNTAHRKSKIVEDRFKDASQRVAETSARLDQFRRQNHLASPEAELGSQIALRSGLEAQLQAQLVQQQTLRQFAGPDNPELQANQTQIASLRAQIARMATPTTGGAGPNVSGLSELSSEYLNLYRDYRLAQALYEVYARANEQTAVEALVADSESYMQVIEPPNVDAERHYNMFAVALLGLVAALALFTELYAPATGLRWRDLTGPAVDDDR